MQQRVQQASVLHCELLLNVEGLLYARLVEWAALAGEELASLQDVYCSFELHKKLVGFVVAHRCLAVKHDVQRPQLLQTDLQMVQRFDLLGLLDAVLVLETYLRFRQYAMLGRALHYAVKQHHVSRRLIAVELIEDLLAEAEHLEAANKVDLRHFIEVLDYVVLEINRLQESGARLLLYC